MEIITRTNELGDLRPNLAKVEVASSIACMLAGLTAVGVDSTPAHAGAGLVADPGPTSQAPTNSAPNRYRRIKDFFKLPPGRAMGSFSAVAIDHEGHLWGCNKHHTTY
jgi:hypothetical protein